MQIWDLLVNLSYTEHRQNGAKLRVSYSGNETATGSRRAQRGSRSPSRFRADAGRSVELKSFLTRV